MRKINLLTLSLLLSMGGLNAQLLSVGVIGGVPFTNVVSQGSGISTCANGCDDDSAHYTVGPSVRVSLPLSLRVEVDALYRPYGFTSYRGDGRSASISGQEWRFPVVLQYQFPGRLLHPFAEGGLSFEHLANLSANAGGQLISELSHRSVAGLVLGGGVDLNLRYLRVSGELRYTRDTASNFHDASNLNQAEVLFGIRF